ncbi:MAG: dTDP-4-dehydrorhamnose 3,5-epimerase family protein [Candidatus Limnocylindria bacterium]
MRFEPTAVAGAYLVDLEPREDERGFFARAWSTEEFAAVGIDLTVRAANMTYTRARGTIRGLHYQVAPALEAKFIRCIRGAAFSAIADMRPDSPTHRAWVGVELDAAGRRALYIPAGCAAGAQALEDDTEMYYLVSGSYSPEHERGVRFDDPAIGIAWPLPAVNVTAKDQGWPLLAEPKETP